MPSQFSMGQTVQSLTSSVMEKPHTGLDDCLRMVLSCFREKVSGHILGEKPLGFVINFGVSCDLCRVGKVTFERNIALAGTSIT